MMMTYSKGAILCAAFALIASVPVEANAQRGGDDAPKSVSPVDGAVVGEIIKLSRMQGD